MAGRCGCARGCNCCTVTTPSVAVSGSGSAGACFQPEVRYSADAGNRARAGSDGGVLADACLYGPNGEPLNPDGSGCFTLPAPCILDYNGDPIAPEGGCVQLPTAGPPPDFGCGLRTDEEGRLIAATSGSWPLDDLTGAAFGGAYTDAQSIFCDPDGFLRGLPDHTAVSVGASDTLLEPDLVPVSGTYTSPASPTMTIANPSPARRLTGVAFVVLIVDVINAVGSGAVVRVQSRVNGGAWTTVRELRWPENLSGSAAIRSQNEATARVSATIAAGASWTLEVRGQVYKSGSGDDPIVASIVAATRFLGVTV